MSDKVNESMLDLFNLEVETQASSLMDTLLNFEDCDDIDKSLETMMRTSHSIKGAARLVNVNLAIKLSHTMEDCFVAAQENKIEIDSSHINIFIKSVDFLNKISKFNAAQHENPANEILTEIEALIKQLENILNNKDTASAKTDNKPDKNIEQESELVIEEDNEHLSYEIFSIPSDIDPAMLDLFKTELENNIEVISDGLLSLEEDPQNAQYLEKLMRASHSIKGAARLLGIESVVKLAHAMEDCFVVAQSGKIIINEVYTDIFLQCTDILKTISALSNNEHAGWTKENSTPVHKLITELNKIESGKYSGNKKTQIVTKNQGQPEPEKRPELESTTNSTDSIVRVSAKRINNLMGLAGELSVTSNWVRNFSDSMLGLKKKHNELIDTIDRLRNVLEDKKLTDLEHNLISNIQLKASNYRDKLTTQIIELDDFDRRSSNLTARINHEIISSRMRPFKDSTQGYKRMVRDIAKSLNKKIKLVIIGEDTQVDREILEKIEAPINHMIRNAIDHGIETPEERIQKDKPEQGIITLEAAHNAGRLSITVSDNGRGVNIEMIRNKVLDKKLVSKTMAESLSKSELLDFLFLPAFSTKDKVTEISGRGVGLDVVHSSLQEMRGKLHATTELGHGMKIQMELPLTLSVIRSLLVKINNELYAFPLAAIHNLITINKKEISVLEDKQYITIDEKHVGLIHTAQILGTTSSDTDSNFLSIVIVGDWNNLYGLVVDEMIGQRGLALRPLDSRLGKIKDINSSALTDDGEPILVFDVDDLIQSIQDIVSGKNIVKVGTGAGSGANLKRILVVDDSLTVREVEKKLLESRGYTVDVAIDGVDGWNTVRTGDYALVISDVDMPRMNGIEFVTLIKNDASLRNTPVMMVSYKDRPEDKQRGLEAGADYYLTKGSFHDETLVDAVRDLIGDPE